MHKVSGECHCGNIRVDVELKDAPASYHPRACDCDFCRKHGAAYVSDANGTLVIQIKDARERGTYRQGSRQADLIVCRTCGVLVGALHRSDGHLYGTVNVRVLEGAATFGAEKGASPQKLSGDEKAKRWQDIWFCNVQVHGDDV
jgi:hypothetical protein